VSGNQRFLHILLPILLSTPNESVHFLARKLATHTITLSTGEASEYKVIDERTQCLQHEAALWIDGLTLENVFYVCKFMDAASRVSVQHAVLTSVSWRKQFPSEPHTEVCFSSLLSAALYGVTSDLSSCSHVFVWFVCQVSAKMLIFQSNPLLLAATILECCNPILSQSDEYGRFNSCSNSIVPLAVLQSYARFIVEGVGNGTAASSTYCSRDMALALFGERNFHTCFSNASSPFGYQLGLQSGVSVALIRQAFHEWIISNGYRGTSTHEAFDMNKIICRSIIHILMVSLKDRTKVRLCFFLFHPLS